MRFSGSLRGSPREHGKSGGGGEKNAIKTREADMYLHLEEETQIAFRAYDLSSTEAPHRLTCSVGFER